MRTKPEIRHNAQAPARRPPDDDAERIGEGELDEQRSPAASFQSEETSGEATEQLLLPGATASDRPAPGKED